MKRNLKQKIYSLTLKRMPRQQRSVEDFYFIYFCLSGGLWLLIISPIFYYSGLEREAWTTGLSFVVTMVLLILWRIGLSRIWLQNTFHATLMSVILYNAYHTGGIFSPYMVWIGVVSILPLFTTSKRSGYLSQVVSFLCVFAVYTFQINDMIPYPAGLDNKDMTIAMLVNALLCITLLMLLVTYDSIHAHHLRIIERKNAALKKLFKDLQIADTHKDKFLATVSHEMRTPLNAMMGYLGLLQTSKNLPPTEYSYVDGAKSASTHLLTVINDLLDFSQIQKGKLILSLQEVDLLKVLKETHKSLELKASDKSLNYKLNIDDNVPQWIKIDPHRLTQIYLNLLGNALKFTQKGEVITHVLYEPAPQEQGSGYLILQVQDTGIGIPQSFLNQIFEPFSQLPVSFQNESSLHGNGLGLSITKTLVSHMGGKITLDSQIDVGSVFEIQLPIRTVSAPSNKQPTEATFFSLVPIYLLLVDDHATNRLVASATIKQDLPNARIDQACNGAEAIQKMKANKYDLVLMDMIMPDYSGIEVTRIIRSECIPPLSDVKVVALTANVAESLVHECAEVGIYEILRKPFDRTALVKTVVDYSNLS
jgi:signal transduction histidine kinase/ActR/RegA family two-component response regulator